jgi:hypothetical protein
MQSARDAQRWLRAFVNERNKLQQNIIPMMNL